MIEILKHVDLDAHVILWDRQGQRISSIGFADLLQDQIDYGKNINFIIGGAPMEHQRKFLNPQN